MFSFAPLGHAVTLHVRDGVWVRLTGCRHSWRRRSTPREGEHPAVGGVARARREGRQSRGSGPCATLAFERRWDRARGLQLPQVGELDPVALIGASVYIRDCCSGRLETHEEDTHGGRE